MAETAYGTVRGTALPNFNDLSVSPLGINRRGEQLVAAGLPAKTSLAMVADSWTVQIATGSAFTNVAAMPTTRAELALYNGDSQKCYVIDAIWFLSLTSVTAAAGATMIYQVAFPAALTNDTAQLINSPLGKDYNGKAKRAVAVTTMTANKWAVVGAAGTGAAASIGHGAIAQIDGGIILIPGATLGVNVVVGTATGTSLMGIAWHEVLLPVV